MVGSMLFSRQVSGARTVKPGEKKVIGEVTLEGFGSSNVEYGDAYLTAAVAIGMDEAEGDEFLARLDKVFADLRKKEAKDAKKKKKETEKETESAKEGKEKEATASDIPVADA